MASAYGQHDANWLAFHEYFREACALDAQTQKLCGLWEIARSANWWLPHQNICWISERHNILNRDDRGRLHCDDGPALAYPDGWCIWAVRGVRVDEQVILKPRTQTIEQIGAEQNAEIKRVRIERFGWEAYLKKTKARVIDSRRNDAECTREALMQAADGMTVLVCHCPSTARIYAMEVEPTIRTCENAQNYLWSGSRLNEFVSKQNCLGRS